MDNVEIQSDPTPLQAGSPARLTIRLLDPSTGKPLQEFAVVHEKLLHFILVRQDLEEFLHEHPTYAGNGVFTLDVTLPTEGTYHGFLDYAPVGAENRVSLVHLQTSGAQNRPAHLIVSPRVQVVEDAYEITLQSGSEYPVNAMTEFAFAFKNPQTGQPYEDLDPYLGAFGHLVVLSEDGETYLHVHPIQEVLGSTSNGGPIVRFHAGFEQKGLYKLFLQFNHAGKVRLATFIVEAR